MVVCQPCCEDGSGSTTPVVQSPRKQRPEQLANQSWLATPTVSPKRVADRSPDHPGAKYQLIEDSEDELIAGAAEGVQEQQLQQQGLRVRARDVQSSG